MKDCSIVLALHGQTCHHMIWVLTEAHSASQPTRSLPQKANLSDSRDAELQFCDVIWQQAMQRATIQYQDFKDDVLGHRQPVKLPEDRRNI